MRKNSEYSIPPRRQTEAENREGGEQSVECFEGTWPECSPGPVSGGFKGCQEKGRPSVPERFFGADAIGGQDQPRQKAHKKKAKI